MKTIPLIMVSGALSVLYANGGPVEVSDILGIGNPVHFVRRDVSLLNEGLTIKPGMRFVEVEAVYTLVNLGDTLETGYAFPVDIAPSGYENDYPSTDVETLVPEFRVLLDGEPIEYTIRDESDISTFVNEYGEEQEFYRLFFMTEFQILPGDTVQIAVRYTFKPRFEDMETSKSFFTGFGYRSFRYSLDPAGYWGDGTAGRFSLSLDMADLMEQGGTAVEVPEGGAWISPGVYLIDRQNVAMSEELPLNFVYDVHTPGISGQLLTRSIPPEYFTVTASSVLPSSANADYGVSNLTDGDLSTAWAEGEAGSAGAWIEIEFQPGVHISYIGIVPGYAKSEEAYLGNSRPGTIDIDASLTGWDHSYAGDYTNEVQLYDVPWEQVSSGRPADVYTEVYNSGDGYNLNNIRLTFREAYPGQSYQDLCISELIFCGWMEDI